MVAVRAHRSERELSGLCMVPDYLAWGLEGGRVQGQITKMKERKIERAGLFECMES